MSIRRDKIRVGRACLVAFGLLAVSGCGDEGPAGRTVPQALRPMANPQTAALTPLPSTVTDADPLAVPNPPTAGLDDQAADAPDTDGKTPDPLADGDDALVSPSGPKMPTLHSHWLKLAQSGERVTVRLNGVWYGDFSGPVLRDITMALRPGPNTLTVTYRPQDASSWLTVRLLEGEHHPPIPDLVTCQVRSREGTGGGRTAGPTAMTATRSFHFMAQ